MNIVGTPILLKAINKAGRGVVIVKSRTQRIEMLAFMKRRIACSGGRTIHHLHVQIIPRFKGDVKNPTGGIRTVIPGFGDYTQSVTKD